LTKLRANNLISKSYIYQRLSQITAWGQQTPLSENKKRYADLFANHLLSYSDLDLQPDSKAFLNDNLNFLKESI